MALGIENLKKVLKFANDFGVQVAQTKKFNFMSIFGFIDDLIALGGLVNSFKDIVAEFNDLDDSERDQLHDYAVNTLSITREGAREFVANAFQWALTTYALVQDAKKLK